jgi:hypothetical protein
MVSLVSVAVAGVGVAHRLRGPFFSAEFADYGMAGRWRAAGAAAEGLAFSEAELVFKGGEGLAAGGAVEFSLAVEKDVVQ